MPQSLVKKEEFRLHYPNKIKILRFDSVINAVKTFIKSRASGLSRRKSCSSLQGYFYK
jgi:hypothetical protein